MLCIYVCNSTYYKILIEYKCYIIATVILWLILLTLLNIFRVHWKPGGMDPDDDYHETYLNKFKNTNLFKLQTLIKKSLDDDPELKSRKKIVEVCFVMSEREIVSRLLLKKNRYFIIL